MYPLTACQSAQENPLIPQNTLILLHSTYNTLAVHAFPKTVFYFFFVTALGEFCQIICSSSLFLWVYCRQGIHCFQPSTFETELLYVYCQYKPMMSICKYLSTQTWPLQPSVSICNLFVLTGKREPFCYVFFHTSDHPNAKNRTKSRHKKFDVRGLGGLSPEMFFTVTKASSIVEREGTLKSHKIREQTK